MSQSTRTSTTLLDGLFDPRNTRAWRIFDGRYRPLMLGYARRKGLQEADAEDLAQMTLADFAQAYRDGQYDRQRGRLRHWLGGLAARRAADMFRRKGRQIKPICGVGKTEILNSASDPEGFDQLWEQEWEQHVLTLCKQHVRKEFGKEYRQVFEQYILGDRPATEVAAELGVTKNAVYVAKSKILARIRELRETMESSG